MSQPPIDLEALWKYVTEQVKTQIVQPNFWRALEAARPLTIENDELVLGFPLAASQLAGMLGDNRNRNTVEQTLERAARRRLKLRVISGDTPEDWEHEKRQAEEAAKLTVQSRQQYARRADAEQSWDGLAEQLVRKFQALPNRGLASVQGRYLAESVAALAEGYERLMGEGAGEMEERNYSRALDRVAERAGVSSSFVAYLVQERRNSAG